MTHWPVSRPDPHWWPSDLETRFGLWSRELCCLYTWARWVLLLLRMMMMMMMMMMVVNCTVHSSQASLSSVSSSVHSNVRTMHVVLIPSQYSTSSSSEGGVVHAWNSQHADPCRVWVDSIKPLWYSAPDPPSRWYLRVKACSDVCSTEYYRCTVTYRPKLKQSSYPRKGCKLRCPYMRNVTSVFASCNAFATRQRPWRHYVLGSPVRSFVRLLVRSDNCYHYIP